MRALLLCAVIGVCASGAYGARRRFSPGPPRPVQRRPSGWREFQPNERLDFEPEFRRPAPQEQLRLAPQESFRPAPQEPFRPAPQEQLRLEPAAPAADDWPARGPVVQEREDPVPEPLEPLEPQRSEFTPTYSEPEAAADSAPEQYAITIPEKTEKNRLEFQVHGQQGPHSYRFGYDTGSGYNRQFRFEERDGDGNLKGRYGFYKDGKLQVVNYSATHEGGFVAEGDFGKFPASDH